MKSWLEERAFLGKYKEISLNPHTQNNVARSKMEAGFVCIRRFWNTNR